MANLLSDRYLLTTPLGEGGFSSVYKATDTRLDREVAIKILKPDLSEQDGMIERFMREAKLTASLKHPHSLQIFDYGHSEGQLYIVSELLNGLTLDQVVKEFGPLSEAWICEYFVPLCLALNEAHEIGIIHRDLKPSNLFLHTWGQDTRLIVIDFGISKDESNEVSKVTKTGQIFGTPHYMSPEQIQSPNQLEASSDLYSLGIILFELINGSPPFNRETMYDLLSDHIKTEPPFLGDRSSQCSLAFANLVNELLSKSPADRPQSALEIAHRLQSINSSNDANHDHFDDKRSQSVAPFGVKSHPTSPTLGITQDSKRQANEQILTGKVKSADRLNLTLGLLGLAVVLTALSSYFFQQAKSDSKPDQKVRSIKQVKKISAQPNPSTPVTPSSSSLAPNSESKKKIDDSSSSLDQVEAQTKIKEEVEIKKDHPKKRLDPKSKDKKPQRSSKTKSRKKAKVLSNKRRSRRGKKLKLRSKLKTRSKAKSKTRSTATPTYSTKKASISPNSNQQGKLKATVIKVEQAPNSSQSNSEQPKITQTHLTKKTEDSPKTTIKSRSTKNTEPIQANQKKRSELMPKTSATKAEDASNARNSKASNSNASNATPSPKANAPKQAPRPPVGF